MDEMKPCPFCGGEVELLDYTDRIYGFWDYKIKCKKCRLSANLKPCPFCGGEAAFVGETATIKCKNCGGAFVVTNPFISRTESAEAWNGRADNLVKDAPAADVVEVVRKPVVGYENHYVVDQFGRVYGVDRTTTVLDNGRIYEKPIAGKQMKQSLHTKGYKTVSLTKDGKTKTMFVHRIVAEAFIPNVDNLPMVNHKDEDKTNNSVENLEWCTPSYNRTYGNAIEKHAKKIRGKKHTAEHNQKISESVIRSYGEKKEATP